MSAVKGRHRAAEEMLTGPGAEESSELASPLACPARPFPETRALGSDGFHGEDQEISVECAEFSRF